MAPNMGMGANTAMEDSRRLAELLGEEPAVAEAAPGTPEFTERLNDRLVRFTGARMAPLKTICTMSKSAPPPTPPPLRGAALGSLCLAMGSPRLAAPPLSPFLPPILASFLSPRTCVPPLTPAIPCGTKSGKPQLTDEMPAAAAPLFR